MRVLDKIVDLNEIEILLKYIKKYPVTNYDLATLADRAGVSPNTIYFFESIPGLVEFAGPNDIRDRVYEANLLIQEEAEEESYNPQEYTLEED